MADNAVNIPSGFGGLVNFKDEYESTFYLKPASVMIFVAAIVAFRIFLGFYFKV